MIGKMKEPLSGTVFSPLAIYVGNSIRNNATQVLGELGKHYKQIPYFYRSQINFNYNLGNMIMVAGIVGLIISLGIGFYRVKKNYSRVDKTRLL